MKHTDTIAVLLVEDTPGDAIIVRKTLAEAGDERFHVTETSRLAGALALLEDGEFQVILLDLNLPDSRGLEGVRRVHEKFPGVPILVLTGIDDRTLAVQAVRAGAQDYLCKSHLESDLLARSIRHALERHRLLRELKASNDRYMLAGRGANDGLWDWNLDNDEAFFSPRWTSILGYDETDVGRHIDEWFRRVHFADLEHLRAAIQLHKAGVTDHLESEYRMRHRDGAYRWMLCRGLVVRNDAGKPTRIVGSQTDITRLKLAEVNLVHDAYHDALTRLHNRHFFLNCLTRVIERARHHKDYRFAVLFLDLDGFKIVNDSLGHSAGDQLLVAVARRLVDCVRPTDYVARLGGDEFTVLIDDLADPSQALQVAERIHETLTAPVVLNGSEVFVNTSIGIASSSVGYDRAEDILRDADTAMYRAKGLGKGRAVVFDGQMHANAVARLNLETDFRKALASRQGFHVHYQPIVSCATGRIVGLEALARWQHPERGWVGPDDFIPLAEESGLISTLGELVFGQVCADAVRWHNRFPERSLPSLSVNLSCKQLTRETVQFIRRTLDAARRKGGGFVLNLEVTESILLDGSEATTRLLHELRELGIHLCIDDFGTGYSCLRYLRKSPFDILKIDRSFIGDMLPDGENSDLVRTIVALGQNLGLTTVAEGVETQSQFEQLREMGCDYAQGFLFSRAVDADTAGGLLEREPFLV